MTGSPVHFSAHLRAQVPVHLCERADARNTSLRFHRERSHAIPAVVLTALNGEANSRLLRSWIQHRHTEIVTTFDQIFRNIQRAIEYRVSREPFPDVDWDSNDGRGLGRSQFNGQRKFSVNGSDSRVQPPHMNRYHRAGVSRLRIFQAPQNETVSNPLLKALELTFPFRRNRRGFYVHGARMPAQCLIENVVKVVAPFLPTCHRKTNFQRDWFVLPNVLNPRAHYLLRIDLQH